MPVVGSAKVIPESLDATWMKLRAVAEREEQG
jgi:hypothetical protein